MSQLSEAAIRDVVSEVLSALQTQSGSAYVPPSPKSASIKTSSARHGVFDDAATAARAARGGFEQLKKQGFAGRAKVIDIVKTMCADNADHWGKIEFDEAGIGRLDHKIAKLHGIRNV